MFELAALDFQSWMRERSLGLGLTGSELGLSSVLTLLFLGLVFLGERSIGFFSFKPVFTFAKQK